jgi:hypothetical protein
VHSVGDVEPNKRYDMYTNPTTSTTTINTTINAKGIKETFSDNVGGMLN